MSLLSFRDIVRLISPWWRSEEKWLAWMGTIILVGGAFFSVYIGVLFNEWSKIFYGSIENRDINAFNHQIFLFGPLLIIVLFDYCARAYLSQWMSFRWRFWYTRQVQNKWLENKAYYTLPLSSDAPDNPDQRISQDVSNMCYTAMDLFQSVVREGINIATFSTILWGMSSGIVVPYFGWNIPGLLFWAALIYAIIGTLTTLYFGNPLIALDVEQEKREADFRYRLMRLHERREEIAKLQGEKAENKRLIDSFHYIRENYYKILKRNIYLNLFQNFFSNSNMFIPLILCGPLYFSGVITLAVLMQIRGMFGEIQQSFSLIAFRYTMIAGWIASMKRLNHFQKNIEVTNLIPFKVNETLFIENLQIFTPLGEKIIFIPSLSLKKGEFKVIQGTSGIGKTSLFRVLRGIYPYFKGDVRIPAQAKMMVIPQRPYMPIGTLKECITYPLLKEYTTQEICRIMKLCQIDYLQDKLEIIDDYQNRLSLGEQQRLHFARALLHKPDWLLMDEPFSNLNEDLAKDILKTLLQELKETGILMISHQHYEEFTSDQTISLVKSR